MMYLTIIGNIGADARVVTADGGQFITFRVAHNDSYKRADGTQVDKVSWVDCTMSLRTDGQAPAVLPYLKAGQLVYVQGNVTTRVYSSEKDRCMKAGLTCHVRQVELLGSSNTDSVPRRLFDDQGVMVDVAKYFFVANYKDCYLYDQRGQAYVVNPDGWVSKAQSQPAAPSEQPAVSAENVDKPKASNKR